MGQVIEKSSFKEGTKPINAGYVKSKAVTSCDDNVKEDLYRKANPTQRRR